MKKIKMSNMKFVGVIREIDKMGRIVISAEARKLMGIKEGDDLEQTLCVDEDGEFVIMVRKYSLCNGDKKEV